MKRRMTIRMPEGVDTQKFLRRLSRYFEDEWEPATNEVTEDSLVVTRPRRVRLGKYYAPRRLGPALSAFEHLQLRVTANEIKAELRVSNWPVAIVTVLVFLAFFCAGQFRWVGLVMAPFFLPFLLFPICSGFALLNRVIRKRIQGILEEEAVRGI